MPAWAGCRRSWSGKRVGIRRKRGRWSARGDYSAPRRDEPLDRHRDGNVPWRARRAPACRPMSRVLLADYEFPDLDLERELYAHAGAELVAAQCRTEADVIAAARRLRRHPAAGSAHHREGRRGAAAARHRQPHRRRRRHRRYRRPAHATASGSPMRPITASAKSRRTRWRSRSRCCATSSPTIAISAPVAGTTCRPDRSGAPAT